MSFTNPNLTDAELDGMRGLSLDRFEKILNLYKAAKVISGSQWITLNEIRRDIAKPIVSRQTWGGKRCRRTYRKRILNKDMKPMHKSMHKSMHRGRCGKRRSFRKY